MSKKYDIALCMKNQSDGLKKKEIKNLCKKIGRKQVYPIEVFARKYQCCAIGFITVDAAEKLNFDYSKSGLEIFIADILDDEDRGWIEINGIFNGLKLYITL